jgi:hypothetical protein
MKMLAGIVAALALVYATGAYAQIIYPGAPYPYPGAVYMTAPAIVAPAPPVVVAPAYNGAYIPDYYSTPVVVNPYTGRWCRFEPSGYRWCWTP